MCIMVKLLIQQNYIKLNETKGQKRNNKSKGTKPESNGIHFKEKGRKNETVIKVYDVNAALKKMREKGKGIVGLYNISYQEKPLRW